MSGVRDRRRAVAAPAALRAGLVLLGLYAPCLAARAHGDTAGCGTVEDPRVVWCGAEERLSFRRLALCAAPVLWFSPDEPLLRERKRAIPQRILCDRLSVNPGEEPPPADSALVYYQVARVLVSRAAGARPETRETLRDQAIPVKDTSKLALRYYFYYEEDFGFNPHVHDLEGIEMQVAVEESGASPGERCARLLSVKGFAHGSDWQANILQVPNDRSLVTPLTVLVEEGKHASCPDRNGDGLYTPGYDVNVRANDAWGVRDIFASRLPSPRFRQEHSKPRTRRAGGYYLGAAMPPEEPATGQRLLAEKRGVAAPAEAYELASAHELEPCSGAPPRRAGRLSFLDLGKSMAQRRFGQALPEVYTSRNTYRYGPLPPLQTLRGLAVSVAHDGQPLVSVSGYLPDELRVFGGWPLARATWSLDGPRRFVLDMAYTPSVSRFADWYAAAGWRHELGTRPGGGNDSKWELEAGLQLRWQFIGVRLGGRTRVAHFGLSDERIVVELGLGPFPGGSVRGRE